MLRVLGRSPSVRAAVSRRAIVTRFGRFDLHRFGAPYADAFALVRGDAGGEAPLLARVHSACMTSEFLGARDCDCAEQLANALGAIAAAGRGVLVYLMQEGRGAGLLAKARDRMMVQANGERITTFEAFERMGLPGDRRSYEVVPALLALLGVEAPLRLLTHNPEKRARLESAGVGVLDTLPLPASHSPWNAHYLAAKASHGHALTPPAAPGARLPERVTWFEPQVLPRLPRFLHAARYLLPVEAGWLHASVYWDRVRSRERFLLEPLAAPRRCGAAPSLVQPQALVDRLPLAPPGPTQRAWARTARALVTHAVGRALVLGPDEPEALDRETRGLLEVAEAA